MSWPAVREFWKRLMYLGSLFFGAETVISTSPMVETPPSIPWMSLRDEKQGQAFDKPHDEEDDAVAENAGLKEKLRSDARGEAPPEGSRNRSDHGGGPHDHADPEHRSPSHRSR